MKKLSLLIALLVSVSIFAQNGSFPKGDINEDGVIDVADIVSLIKIIVTEQEPSYFYLGTIVPTEENYKTLPGVSSSYSSIDDVEGVVASIAQGEILYILCPERWMVEKNVVAEDEFGNTYYFSDKVNTTTVLGYVIYQTDVWSNAAKVTIKIVSRSSYRERPLLYKGDTKAHGNHIVNAVIYPDNTIIAARAGGSIVKIAQDGTETTLLTINGASDWRGLFIDSQNNVYASPHASIGSKGGFQMTSRGLYKLSYGDSSFVKVISLYNATSSNPKETEENDDTIWTLCEDRDGYLYAGVYCHTKRYAPRIYRSTDGGNTWADYYDFLQILPSGRHIHSIIYNQYNDALYCIVGEKNTLLKSTDHGTTWTNLNTVCEGGKGSSMIAVNDGIIIGSDIAYECIMSKLYADDSTIKTTAKFWANTVFAIRRSDITGWLYAFTKIDSAVNNDNYMPPIGALTNNATLETWIESNPTYLSSWLAYHNDVKDIYPDDAIRPQHCGILISKDDGETWEVLYRYYTTSFGANGFVTTGYFKNGECLTGLFVNSGNGMQVQNPIIISEHLHQNASNVLNLEGEIFIRTNSSNIVVPLN